MLIFLYSLLAFLVATGLLISVHEFGHFWVAKRLGIKVLRFCIGFGKPLLTWHDRQGTEYVLAAIPLGGYVKMLDETETVVASNERHRAFNNKPVWVRMLVIAAGPAFNLGFAVIAYWLVFMIGIVSMVPIIGDVPKGSVAYIAGLRSGQEIIKIDDQATSNWEEIAVALMSQVGDRSFINVVVRDHNRHAITVHALNLSNWSLGNNDENILKNLGLEPIDPVPPIVGKVLADMPAAKVGLKAGDLIISIDGKAVASRSALMALLHDKYDRAVHLEYKRNHEIMTTLITPTKKLLDGGDATGFIGIQFEEHAWPKDLIRTQHEAPWPALHKAYKRTLEYSELTLQFLYKMVTGKMSLQHVAGPISIAKFAGRTALSGPAYFLSFLALVSISLGVLNMLPIPILDGGHFLFCIIELIRGKALSVKAMQFGNSIGFVVLGSFMLLAVYNDVIRIMS